MMLFAFIAVALVGLLSSSIVANDLSRQKTVGQQLAQDQVEDIRRLDYDDVGTVGGNPSGVVAATRTTSFRGYDVTITTSIQYVNDPTPTSYATYANYKKVTVTVTSNRNGRVLASVVTYVAPPSRAPFGGLNNAIVNVTVKDLQTQQLIGAAAVNLSTGPSAPLSDSTDVTTGLVTFAGLTPNPTSGGQAYYDIAVSKSGYETYVDFISPAAPAHVQLAPSQTLDTEILLYRPVTITVNVLGTSGTPYTAGPATVKLSSERSGTTQTYTATGGSTPAVTTFAGRPTAPGNFTARAFTSTGLCASPVTQLAWDTYPATLASAITVQLAPCPTGTLVVNVTQLGGPAVGATVQVSAGPNDYAPITGTTNSSGQVTFTNLPSGTDPYTITATDAPGNVSGNTTATISTGATTTKTINLSNPPMGSISGLVRWLGVGVNGATVTVTGGPYSVNLSQTTNSSGNASFSNNVPAGTGYTVTATKNGISKVQSGVSVTSGSTTNVTLDMPTGTINVAATWASLAAGNVGGTPSVSVTGGPDGGTYNTTITNSGGTASIVVPATTASTPYTVTVTKNTGSGNASVTTLASGGTAPANVALSPTKTLTLTIQANGVNIPNQPVTVSLTDGPNGNANANPAYQFVGNTNASSRVVLTLPVHATETYTVKVYRTGCPGTTNRSRTQTVSAAAGTTTATINMTTATCPLTLP
jgi:hypothetical protein